MCFLLNGPLLKHSTESVRFIKDVGQNVNVEFTSADKRTPACSAFNYALHTLTHTHTHTVSNNLSEPKSRRNQPECEIENKQSFQIAALLRQWRLALCLKPGLSSDQTQISARLVLPQNPDLTDGSPIAARPRPHGSEFHPRQLTPDSLFQFTPES